MASGHYARVDGRSFLRSLPDMIVPRIDRDLRRFRISARWVIVQLYYGNRDIHYEAWHRGGERTIEIGLHFEADEMTNARLLGAFRSHERAIHRALPNARLEEWDKGWTRIWEPVAAQTLDEALQRDVAARIARYITTLEPILRNELPADVPWSLTPIRPVKRRSRTTHRSALRSRPRARAKARAAKAEE